MAVKTKIKFKMTNMAVTLKRLGLGADRSAEKKLASEIVRTTEPYVPFDKGGLKETVEIVTTATNTQIKYIMPYAARQYYSGGEAGYNEHEPLRGRYWIERSKADHMEEWTAEFHQFVNGSH